MSSVNSIHGTLSVVLDVSPSVRSVLPVSPYRSEMFRVVPVAERNPISITR
jgi:hypothetical protein